MNLEELANWLNDMDASWYPFLFLRPAQDERIGNRKVALLSALYGIFFGVLLNVLLRALHAEHAISPFAFPAALTFGFFVSYRFTFAIAWNLRAARLADGGGGSSMRVLSERARAWRANFED